MSRPLIVSALVIVGLGCLIVYSVVLRDRITEFREYRDRRARRDLVEGIGLWIVAVSSAAAIFLVFFPPSVAGLRGWAVGVAVGAFFALGLLMVSERPAKAKR